MRTIGRIAVNVFRESVRDKVLYNLRCRMLMIGAGYARPLGGPGLQDRHRPRAGRVSLFDLHCGLHRHRPGVEGGQRKSITACSPSRFTATSWCSAYAGLILTLVVNVSIMAIGLYAVMHYVAWQFPADFVATWDVPPTDPRILKAVGLIVVELSVVTAIALFFSTFSTPILSAAFTFALWIAVHFSADLRNFEQVVQSPFAAKFARGLYWVLPNLATFDVKGQVVHGQPVDGGFVMLAIAYGLTYIAVLLIGAVTIFSRRDFK